MTSVALLGTLDTKGHEYAFLRERLVDLGVETLVVDVGVARAGRDFPRRRSPNGRRCGRV